jgi:hypothetical protein
MTAPVGATVRLYVDLVARVAVDDVIETASGRRYQVLGVREQQRGHHAGRQHLQCLVMGPEWHPEQGTRIHEIRWYPRGGSKRRRDAKRQWRWRR